MGVKIPNVGIWIEEGPPPAQVGQWLVFAASLLHDCQQTCRRCSRFHTAPGTCVAHAPADHSGELYRQIVCVSTNVSPRELARPVRGVKECTYEFGLCQKSESLCTFPPWCCLTARRMHGQALSILKAHATRLTWTAPSPPHVPTWQRIQVERATRGSPCSPEVCPLHWKEESTTDSQHPNVHHVMER